jgi:5-methylthioribose kinase
MLPCRSQRQALLHNDLHAGNLLITQDSLHLIDWEFATYGPPAFDLGSLAANLLLARSCLVAGAAAAAPADGKQGHEQQEEGAAVQQQREWLLQVVQQVWEGVCRPAPGHGPSILEAMLSDSSDSAAGGSSASADSSSSSTQASESNTRPASTSASSCTQKQGSSSQAGGEGGWTAKQLQQAERQLLADSVGFAGMCMVRQLVGMHHYQGFDTIPDRGARVQAEQRCLQLGMELLVGRQQFDDVPSVLQCVRRHDHGACSA